jgi:hypothetical protein
MKLGVMQPYFMPYIGYFQLIAAVDIFVVYDNIKYTKKGWINRNRILMNGEDLIFSLPLKNGSDNLDILNRELSSTFDRRKLLRQLNGAYSKAPYFNETFQLLKRIINCEHTNLFQYIHYSLTEICSHLGIDTEIRISSDIVADHTLKGEERVLNLCQTLGAKTYINSIGGIDLYNKDVFSSFGITLRFLKSNPILYKQFETAFVPWLSIIDVMMFNPVKQINEYLMDYELT